MPVNILLTWSFFILPIYGAPDGSTVLTLETLSISDSFEILHSNTRPRLAIMLSSSSSEAEKRKSPPPKPPRTFTYNADQRYPRPALESPTPKPEPTRKDRFVKTIRNTFRVVMKKIKKGMTKVKNYFSKGFKATKRKLKKMRS